MEARLFARDLNDKIKRYSQKQGKARQGKARQKEKFWMRSDRGTEGSERYARPSELRGCKDPS
eukprot:2617344-Ditylum_brightwellii.AAC.1